jgi:integrase
VKTKEMREVVLHEHLEAQGFWQFIERSTAGYLFLNASPDDDWAGERRGKWRAAKNRLSEFARRVVKAEGVDPNHGWRHMFKTIGRDAGIEDSVLDVICGHAPKSVGGAYGSVTLAGQRAALARFPRFGL